jgi:hypothetical protein
MKETEFNELQKQFLKEKGYNLNIIKKARSKQDIATILAFQFKDNLEVLIDIYKLFGQPNFDDLEMLRENSAQVE